MKRLTPLELKSWMLPLFALAISVPIVAAFALVGPAGGTAAGALIVAAILVIAARMRYDEEIEVATPAGGGVGGVLVVVTAAIEGGAATTVIEAARQRSGGSRAPVLVLAPALNSCVSHWLSDLRGARLAAQERLAVSLAVLATAGITAKGSVGDSDPLQATEDTLRSFPAAEVVFVTGAGSETRVVRDVRRRLDRRVSEVGGADSDAARSASGQPTGR